MIDNNIYNRLQPLDLSEFSNRAFERKRQIDAANAQKQEADRLAKAQQFSQEQATMENNRAQARFDMDKQQFDEEFGQLKESRAQKRRVYLSSLLGEEAETLTGLAPEKRSTYYKSVLLPGLAEDGFDVSDLPPEYDEKYIDTWRMNALPPEKREDLRIQRDKTAKEAQKSTMFDTWKSSLEPYLRSKSFKLKQEDVNRIMSTYPTELAGYAPAEKFLDNLRMQPQPVPGMTTTPRQQFRDIMDLRKDFDDNLEIKAVKVAEQKVQQINGAYNEYKQALANGEENPQFQDQVFAYNFNKMLDEASVVMPGEFQRIAMGAGLTQEIMARVQQAINGGLKFTPEQRADLVRVSNNLWQVTKERANNTYQQYKNEARIYDVDPYRIVGSVQHIFEPGTRRSAPTNNPAGNESKPGKKINEGTTKSGKKFIVEELD